MLDLGYDRRVRTCGCAVRETYHSICCRGGNAYVVSHVIPGEKREAEEERVNGPGRTAPDAVEETGDERLPPIRDRVGDDLLTTRNEARELNRRYSSNFLVFIFVQNLGEMSEIF